MNTHAIKFAVGPHAPAMEIEVDKIQFFEADWVKHTNSPEDIVFWSPHTGYVIFVCDVLGTYWTQVPVIGTHLLQ